MNEYVLDYSIYEHLIHKEEKTLTDLTKKFEEFCREFGCLASGFHKLHVLTEDYDSYEAKVQKAQKEQQRQDEINKEANVPGTVHVDDRGA